MKGISTIMAAILVISIIVAIIAFFHIWTTNILSIVNKAIIISTNKTIITAGTDFRIASLTNTSETEIIVYIRNTGIEDIDMSSIEVYLDDNRISTLSY